MYRNRSAKCLKNKIWNLFFAPSYCKQLMGNHNYSRIRLLMLSTERSYMQGMVFAMMYNQRRTQKNLDIARITIIEVVVNRPFYSLCLFQKENRNYISHEISKEINVFPHSNAPIPTKETLDQPQNILTFFTHRVHSVLPLGLCYG